MPHAPRPPSEPSPVEVVRATPADFDELVLAPRDLRVVAYF